MVEKPAKALTIRTVPSTPTAGQTGFAELRAILIVAGVSGSGKTTVMFAALRRPCSASGKKSCPGSENQLTRTPTIRGPTFISLPALPIWAGLTNPAVGAGLAFNPKFSIRRVRAFGESDNPVFLAQRERMIEAMRMAGAPVAVTLLAFVAGDRKREATVGPQLSIGRNC